MAGAQTPSCQAITCFFAESIRAGRGPGLPCWPARQFESWKVERKETGRPEMMSSGRGVGTDPVKYVIQISSSWPAEGHPRRAGSELWYELAGNTGGLFGGHRLLAEIPQGYRHLHTPSPTIRFGGLPVVLTLPAAVWDAWNQLTYSLPHPSLPPLCPSSVSLSLLLPLLGIELRASYVLGKHSTPGLHP